MMKGCILIMRQSSTKKGKTGKFIRGLIFSICILFIFYLIIGYFGLTASQKTGGFMFSWYGMFAVSIYVIVRCIYPKARLMNIFKIKWFH